MVCHPVQSKVSSAPLASGIGGAKDLRSSAMLHHVSWNYRPSTRKACDQVLQYLMMRPLLAAGDSGILAALLARGLL